MLSALLVMTAIALVLGAMLGFASIKFKVEGDPLVDQIDAILPQTQCGQCGFPGCRPYATAIANGEAEINQCPPGGEEGIRNPLIASFARMQTVDANQITRRRPERLIEIDERHTFTGGHRPNLVVGRNDAGRSVALACAAPLRQQRPHKHLRTTASCRPHHAAQGRGDALRLLALIDVVGPLLQQDDFRLHLRQR